MVLKRRINYQWRIFLPISLGLWVLIIGMYFWQTSKMREIRNEMAYDQLTVIANKIVSSYNQNDKELAKSFADYASRFYDENPNYDELNIWIKNTDTGEIEDRFGSWLNPKFTNLPTGKEGLFKVPANMLLNGDGSDQTFLYVTQRASKEKKEVYVMLPQTKRMEDNVSSSETYFWLICLFLGIAVSVFTFINANLFSRNLKILRNFAYQASTNPNFVLTEDQTFAHDELGDISREIVKIYNQRTVEVERSEREHQIALHAIEEKERIKRELTGNINHELKTPVGVIQGYIDTIVDTPDMDNETRERFLKKAQQSVHRLSTLINDITAITKLESGGKLVNIGEINFHDLTFSFENFIKEGDVLKGMMTFSYDIPLNCMILGNEQLLTTVLLNFVKNSVAYSEGTECRLLMTGEDDDFYYFRYYDNGIGVPPEHLPHMFERFYRVNAGRSRNSGGTGLGLAIVEVTIESFGGKIEVLNHFPTGLEYNFSLPKYKKKAPVAITEELGDESFNDETK